MVIKKIRLYSLFIYIFIIFSGIVEVSNARSTEDLFYLDITTGFDLNYNMYDYSTNASTVKKHSSDLSYGGNFTLATAYTWSLNKSYNIGIKGLLSAGYTQANLQYSYCSSTSILPVCPSDKQSDIEYTSTTIFDFGLYFDNLFKLIENKFLLNIGVGVNWVLDEYKFKGYKVYTGSQEDYKLSFAIGAYLNASIKMYKKLYWIFDYTLSQTINSKKYGEILELRTLSNKFNTGIRLIF